MEERFFFCEVCGNLMIAALTSGVVPYCCDEEMTQLLPNTSDGNHEKHVPVVTFESKHTLRVTIGSELHPMTPKHHIRFVCLHTTTGWVVRYLKEDMPPEVCIRFNGKPLAIYAYCNIHGLWCAEVPKRPEECGTNQKCSLG